MDLSLPHRHTDTGLLFIIFFIAFFTSLCYASTTTPPENHTAITNSIADECIKLFREKRNFSDACSTCKKTGGELYSIKVMTEQPNKEIQKIFIAALNKRSGIWVDAPNKTFCEQNETEKCSKALRDTNTTVTDIPCSSNLEFFCYYKDTLKEPRDAKCSSMTSTATPLTTTTSPTPLPKDNAMSLIDIIPISICVTVSLVLIITAVACCLCKRQRKPAKYAVREASALYHRQNPDVETETGTGPQLMQPDEYDMMENSAYIPCVVTNQRPEDIHAKPENHDSRSCDETNLNENMS